LWWKEAGNRKGTMLYKSLIDTIGNTPLVEINNLNPNKNVKIYAKLEGFNPTGSVKDRIAKYMIESAEKEGILSKDKVLLEPTSGNTGISLGMIARIKGYKLVAVMPESMSVERREILKAFGVEIVLSPGDEGTNGAIRVAKKMVEENHNYIMLDQYSNPNNPDAHYYTTAVEILRDVQEPIDYFVAGLGTGGTLMGAGKRLKEHNQSKSGAHYTKIRRPVKLKYSEKFNTLFEARGREAEIKVWRRKQKEKLWNKV